MASPVWVTSKPIKMALKPQLDTFIAYISYVFKLKIVFHIPADVTEVMSALDKI
jgi:hypothetical protein